MTGQPIYLTVLREGDLVAIDLATVDPVMPRSRLQVSESLLREICGEIARIGSATQQTVHTSWAAQQRHQPLSTSPSEELRAVGRIIFSHLFPQAVRYHLSHSPSTDLFLRLDEQLVHVPWELGFDGQDFLLSKFRIGRQVLTQATSGRPYEDHACLEVPLRMLIILDPTETLAGAEDEAHELCTLLDQSHQIDVVIMGGRRINKLDLLRALNDTDLVHYAGHAVFDPTRSSESGWLLQEGILTASEISHLESPPLLVFSNACHTGATEHWAGSSRFEGEAFGLGSGFLLAGVRHYIGSLWAIHDKRSAGFAHVFYQQLLLGHSIGEALLDARHRALATYGWEELLWAGYLHYGMPSDRLPIRGAASTGAALDSSWSCQRTPSPTPQAVLPEASREVEAAPVTVPPSTHGEDRGTRRWRLPRRWRPISLAAGVGLSMLLFVWALLAGHLGTFSIRQNFEPHSPMMQSLLDRYQQAYVEFQNGQIDRALAAFQLLVASRENLQGLGYDGLAAAYFEAERTDRALELLDEALGRFPQHAIGHLLRGDILYTQGRTADALHEYREAVSGVAVFPWQRAAAQTGIGVFYALQKAWDRATAAFTEAIAADPSSPAAYANLGYLARQEGKEDEAKRWFDKAYARKPTDEVTLYYRQLLQTSTTPPPVWNARKGRLLIFPFVYLGGNLQRLGIGEMLASLIGEALIEDERMAVLAGRDLETALQGNPLQFSGLSNFPAAINVAKVIGADFVVYGSHRHYTNVLAVDARAVHVKTMEVLTSEHLKSYGTDKIRASSQALAAKLRPILADAVQQAIR